MIANHKYYRLKLVVANCMAMLLMLALSGGTAVADDSASAAAAKAAATKTTNVEVIAAKVQAMPKVVSSLGSLQAINQVAVSSEVDGRIVKIYFKSGKQVASGMPIVQLDDQSEQADYEKAVSQLHLDRLKYQRQLLAGDAIAKMDLDNQQATVKQDETEVQSKQAALAKKQITAPFSGVLGDFKINIGDFIKAGVPMVSLVNTEQLRAVYNLSENVLPQLKTGQLSTITVDAYPNKVFYGTVNYISPSIDQTARTVKVTALVKNPQNLLRPGMFMHVNQQIDLQQNALVIPEQGLLVDIKGSYVYLVVNGRAKRADVVLGTRKMGLAQIKSGLQAGDIVVVAGQQKLDEGTNVKVVPTLPAVTNLMDRGTADPDAKDANSTPAQKSPAAASNNPAQKSPAAPADKSAASSSPAITDPSKVITPTNSNSNKVITPTNSNSNKVITPTNPSKAITPAPTTAPAASSAAPASTASASSIKNSSPPIANTPPAKPNNTPGVDNSTESTTTYPANNNS